MIAALLLVAAFHDVRVDAATNAAARALARERMSVYRVDGASAYAVAPDETIADLRARGFGVVVLADAGSPTRAATYRSASEVNASLTALAAQNQDARLERWGTSRAGVPILALRIGDPARPGVRVLGGHHGDEAPSVEVPLRWIEGLLAARATDAAIAAKLARVSLVVAPMVNPDGYTNRTRYNAANVDLNRNYGFQHEAGEFAAGTAPYSEPEVRAVVLDNEWHRYASSLTYHTGAVNIGYPFNFTTQPLATDTRYYGYGTAYATFIASPQFYVTRGAAWFISYGDLNDYSLGYFGGADFTVEMSSTKTPPETALDALVLEHGAAATAWLDRVIDTARVEVRDAVSDEPLPATVTSSEVFARCDPVRGRCEVQASAGATLSVALAGYVTQEIAADLSAIVRVGLERESSLERVRVADGYVTAANAALTIGLVAPASLANVRAFRPGAEDIVFSCNFAAATCTAAAAPRRPGHYALVATFGDGRETTTPNALYLADPLAPAEPPVTPVLNGDDLTIWRQPGGDMITNAAVIEHAGFALPIVDGMVLPTTGRSVDVVYTIDGVLHRFALFQAPDEPARIGEVTTGRTRACGGCDGAGAAWPLAWLVLLVHRRRRSGTHRRNG
ncbi:MAG: DUF2817 domain-containing protein [Deltaproteobacteria bacterium]|nr:DUF2817 domain-containing protein [Deltaproteobacteria bacterium]